MRGPVGTRMIDLAEALKAELPRRLGPPPAAMRVTKAARAPKTFTMQRLRRVAVWGTTAAGALLIAVLASRSDIAVERIAVALHRPKTDAVKPFDAQAETERLAEAIRGLSVNNAQINSRLAAVEHDIDDVTGSINKQIAAAKDSGRSDDGPSFAATAALTAAMALATDAQPAAAAPPATVTPTAQAALPALPRAEFGVDVGSGLTIQALRSRWMVLRTSHPQLFGELQPIVNVKELPRSNRIELRLIAGPIAQPGAAAQLCAAMARLNLFCQPTIYDGQHLALK